MARKTITVTAVLLLAALFATPSSAQDVKIGGYGQTWFLFQQNAGIAGRTGVEDAVSGFRIRRARLNFKTDLNDMFSVDTWFDFVDPSKTLLDFKAIAKISPSFVITLGQFINPAQMYETSSLSSSKLPFYERSDISQKLTSFMGNDSFRDIGLMLSGTFGVVKYGVYYGNGTGRGFQTGNNILNRKFGQGLFGGRVDIEPVKGLVFGGHVGINKQDSVVTRENTLPGYSTPSTVLRNKDRSSYSFNIGTDGLGIPEVFSEFSYGNGNFKDTTSATEYNGWYLLGGYKICKEFHVLARYDTYTQTLKSTQPVEAKSNNITFGVTYLFFNEKTDIVKIGANYVSRKEEPTEVRNNVFVIWTQVRIP